VDNELKSVVKDMANLLVDLSEATADLVFDSASDLRGDLVGRTRDKARSFRDRAKTLREAVNKLQPSKGL
jgi:hypothetical protein